MANTPSFLSLLLLLFLFASSAVARPCKTLFISTYTVAEVRPHLFAVVAEFHEFRPNPQFHHPRPLNFRSYLPVPDNRQTLIPRPEIPLQSTSIRDRTVDILSVLASLLFGAGCGALTAVAMYLVWSFFNCRFVAYRSFDDQFSDDDEEDVEDIFNPKKVCNNEISKPAPPSTADSIETALLNKESV